jgi:hypothetical protein
LSISFSSLDFLEHVFLLRIFRAMSAVRPPVPLALPAITAAVAMHIGHMGYSCGICPA